MDPADYELVIFDLDGTLVHLAVDWAAFRETLAEFLDDEVVCDGPEKPATWTLTQLSDRGDDEAHDRVLQILRTSELTGALGSQTLSPGIDMFRQASQAETPVAVVTNNTRGAAQEALRRHGLRHRVEKLVALEDVDQAKPHPDGLQIVLDAFDVAPDRTLFVGDGAKDRQAAKRAGVDFVDVDEIGDAT